MRGVGLSAPKLRGADSEKSDDEIARSSFDLRSAQGFCFDYFDRMDSSRESGLATPVLRSSFLARTRVIPFTGQSLGLPWSHAAPGSNLQPTRPQAISVRRR
jgi:hypothetical protein